MPDWVVENLGSKNLSTVTLSGASGVGKPDPLWAVDALKGFSERPLLGVRATSCSELTGFRADGALRVDWAAKARFRVLPAG